MTETWIGIYLNHDFQMKLDAIKNINLEIQKCGR